jgi:hypothetical protein
MRTPFKAAWITPGDRLGFFLAGLFSCKASTRYLLAYSPPTFRTSNHASDWVLIQSVAEE